MSNVIRLDGILTRHKRRVTWWLAGLTFLLLVVSLRFSIHQPPVWDGAMSVYPAAIELARTNFDFAGVLALPTYAEGGPNTHVTSPWTVMVAGLIVVTGSLQTALPIIHMVSFALAALIVAATYRLIAHSVPGVIALLGGLAVLLFPPMLVQAADVYLDLPMTCLGTWSLVMLLERRFAAASALATLAIWIKPLAVIFAAVGTVFVLFRSGHERRLRRTLALTTPPVVVAAMVASLQNANSPLPPLLDRYALSVGVTVRLLGTMPDLIAIGIVILLLIFMMIKANARQDIVTIVSLVLVSALGFVAFNPLVSFGIPIIPRYYIALMPAVIAGICAMVASKSRTLAVATATLLILTFAVNMKGTLYPYQDHPFFPLAERSLAYRDLLALQIEDIAVLEELSEELPVYYDYFAFYRFEYPEMGYSQGPPPSGTSVFHSPELANATLADMPSHFAFLFEYPVLGGEVLNRIWHEAKASGASVEETALTRGAYTVHVVEVDQSVAPSP